MKRNKLFINSLIIGNLIICNVNITEALDNSYKIFYLEDTADEMLNYQNFQTINNIEFNYKTRGEYVDNTLNNIFTQFFQNQDNFFNYIPDGTELLAVKNISGHLFLNFNNNIRNYGGSGYEFNLVRQILHTCFQFEEIRTVTFLIEGEFQILPEGNLIFKYDRTDLELLDYNHNAHLRDTNQEIIIN